VQFVKLKSIIDGHGYHPGTNRPRRIRTRDFHHFTHTEWYCMIV
jgi:hypothetical protein